MTSTTKHLTTAILATTLTITPLTLAGNTHAQEASTTQTASQTQETNYTTQQATITVAPNSTLTYKHNIISKDGTTPTVTKISVKQAESIEGVTLKVNAAEQTISITTQNIPENANLGGIDVTYTFSDDTTFTVTDTVQIADTKEDADKANTEAASQSQTANSETAFVINPKQETSQQTSTHTQNNQTLTEGTIVTNTQTQNPQTTNKGTTVTNTQTQTRNPQTTTTLKQTPTQKQTPITIENTITKNGYETQNPTIHITPNSTNEVKFSIYNPTTKKHPTITKVSASQKQGTEGLTVKVDAKQHTLKLIADNTVNPNATLGPVEISFTLKDGTILTAQALPILHKEGFDTNSENTKLNQKATDANANTAFIINPTNAATNTSNETSEKIATPTSSPLETETKTTNTPKTTTTKATATQTTPSPNNQTTTATPTNKLTETQNKTTPQNNTNPTTNTEKNNTRPTTNSIPNQTTNHIHQSQTQPGSILLSNVHTTIKPGESTQVLLHGQGANLDNVTYTIDTTTIPTGWQAEITPDASIRVTIPKNTTTHTGNIQVTATTPEGETATSIFTFKTQTTPTETTTGQRILASTGASTLGLLALASLIAGLGAITILRRKK